MIEFELCQTLDGTCHRMILFALTISSSSRSQIGMFDGYQNCTLSMVQSAWGSALHNVRMHNCLSMTTRQRLLVHVRKKTKHSWTTRQYSWTTKHSWTTQQYSWTTKHSWTTQLHSTMPKTLVTRQNRQHT